MARRKLIWHLGLPDPARPVLPATLDTHREALADLGVHVAADAAEAERAVHELLHTHREAGLKRKQVQGTWSRIADRVWAHRGTSVVSTPGLCAADGEWLRLALDPLIGVEVQLVLTAEPLADQLYGAWVGDLLRGGRSGLRKHAGRVLRAAEVEAPADDHEPDAVGPDEGALFWRGHDLAAAASRWGWTFHADRVHVVAGTPREHWAAVADLLGADPLALPPVVATYADPAAAAVLREVNRRAEEPVALAERRALLAGEDGEAEDAAPRPGRDLSPLAPVVERWSKVLADAGHDVRGDLGALLDDQAAQPLPGPRTRLSVAAQVLAETLAERGALRDRVAELEAEVATLDRKRRTWKRRAKHGTDLAAVG